jgi:putative SOS response-associated peptidase YedK
MVAVHGRVALQPSPIFALKGRKSDPGVTNIRNVGSPHWRRWLRVESRCIVPFTSFAENEVLPNGSRPPVWFALDHSTPTRILGRAHALGKCDIELSMLSREQCR